MPCSADIPGRPAFFLKGNREGVDLGERGFQGDGLGGVEEGEAAIRM